MLAFYKAWRNHRREYVPTAVQGNARFCWVLVSSVSFRHNLSLRCPLCIRYGRIKLNCRYVRTCAYRRKPKSLFLTEHLLVSSRLHEIVSDLFEIKRTFCLLLNSKCRRLLGSFSLSALSLIALTVSKEISLLASSDRMAPPSGLPPPLKSRTKLFTFVFDSVDLFVLLLHLLFSSVIYVCYFCLFAFVLFVSSYY